MAVFQNNMYMDYWRPWEQVSIQFLNHDHVLLTKNSKFS
jgi:hypothetical protein